MKLRYNLMQRRLLRYWRWCHSRGETPVLGCHILPENFMGHLKLVSSCLCVLLITSCAATQTSHILLGQTHNRLQPDQVQIFLQPPAAPYEQVAWIETDSQWDWKFTDRGHSEAVIKRLRSEAAKLGANGILLNQYGTEHIGELTARGENWSYTTPMGVKVARGMAIWLPPPPASPSTRLDAKSL